MNREKFREMYDLLMEQLDVSRELSDDEILGVIDELILTQARELFLSLKEKVELRQELFCSVRKLDVLQELIDDESVTEIMVNGPDHGTFRLFGMHGKCDSCHLAGMIFKKDGSLFIRTGRRRFPLA